MALTTGTTTLRSLVEVELRRMVASGEHRPGSRLPSERQLAERLGISRTIVREAIRRLLEEGVLESRNRSGLYLAEVDLSQVFTTRAIIEPGCARSAAESHDEADALNLANLRQRLLIATSPAEINEIDTELHLAIARATHNLVLYRLMLSLSDLTAFARAQDIAEVLQVHDGVTQIAAVVEHILQRDAAAAEHSMRTHVDACAEATRLVRR